MTALVSPRVPCLDDDQARTLLTVVKAAYLSDDLVQDVMLDFIRMHRNGVPFEGLVSLAKTVVSRKRCLHLRLRYREEARRLKSPRPVSTVSPIEEADIRMDAEAALARLPKPHHDALVRVYRDGESQAAVAERLGCTRDRVRAVLAEAKALLPAG